MTLRTIYERFLAGPTAPALADNASINYITTATTIREAGAIIRHLNAQAKQLSKKGEKILGAIESDCGLCVEVETTLEFTSGGGAYLPGLDDNFLSDRRVTFPIVHVVHFDRDQRITLIRLYWDQGSVLREVEVIGSRSRNWPIRDCIQQTRLIAASVSGTTGSSGGEATSTTNTSRPQSRKSATGDPHASLSLFEPEDDEERNFGATVAPRASAKPPPREYNELFAEDDSARQPGSPFKGSNGRPVKGGAGKKFQEVRLFDEEDAAAEVKSPEKLKTYPTKYNHFEFGDGEDGPPPESMISPPKTNEKKYKHFEFGDGDDAPENTPSGKSKTYDHFELGGEDDPARNTKNPPKSSEKKYKHFELGGDDDEGTPKPVPKPKLTKHQSQWDFDDFTTPNKVPAKSRPQNERHFGWSDDEDDKSPVRRPIVHQARPDAAKHFEFVDDGTPKADKVAPPRKGRAHNEKLGLYEDHVMSADPTEGDNDESERNAKRQSQPQPLGNVTNVKNAANHRRVFDSHFEMRDSSPAPPSANENKAPGGESQKNGSAAQRAVLEDRKKARAGLNASWDLYEESPDRSKENRGIKTDGDGMGGRKDTARGWGFGDEDDDQFPATTKQSEKSSNMPIRTENKPIQNQAEATKGFWDF